MHPIKNVGFLLDAWAKAALPESWHLVLAGTGNPRYLSRLLKQAEQLGLGDRVQFTGNVVGCDKQYLLRRSDWLLLPSKHENFGVVVLEAIQARCAVTLSTEVYLSECFAGFPGAAILPLSTKAWVEFMRTKMLNDEWRQSWKEHCCEVVDKSFSIETVASKWIEVLTDMFGVPICT
jgi:glycosyltransferase involved in cell wall biosynthesis